MNKVHFLQGDCIDIMNRMKRSNYKVDLILTSPPYNTAKGRGTWSKEQKHHYDIAFIDSMSDDDYVDWSVGLFRHFDNILNKDGVVLYNISYSTDKPYLMYRVLYEVMANTSFKIADTIVWKKKNAMPNNMSCNRLTRICELVFVLARENELKTFYMNREVLSVRPNGIKQYNTVSNFIEAKNNDGSNKLNKATFSTELCEWLLENYAGGGRVVYDPFMGTGTTGIACAKLGLECYGSELSEAQVEYSNNRLKEFYENI